MVYKFVYCAFSYEYKNIYMELSKLVTGSNVGVLEGDADNIVKFIGESLYRLTSSIEVKVHMKN